MSKVVAIIQARMGSARLPGKTLAKILDQPMIDILLSRVCESKRIHQIVVATTTEQRDNILHDHLSLNEKIRIFRGSEDDLLDRYYQCALLYKADVIVRITADDPLKDAEIIDEAIELFEQKQPLDYCSNCLEASYPEGLDVEVFSFDALEKAFKNAVLPSEREHLTPYITNNPSIFRLHNFRYKDDLSNWRWTVDKPEDLDFVRFIFKNFKNDLNVSYKDVIEYCLKNPEIVAINQGTIRFEGYWKTVNEKD